MSIVQQLFEKPWETSGDAVALDAGRSFRLAPEALALRVFLVVVSVLFSLLVAAYGVRMAFEDWRPAPEPWLLWVNTGLLVAASVAIQAALISLRRRQAEHARHGMLLAGALAIAFLLGQIAAWRQLQGFTVFDITNPAIAFFYLITGLHALHLLGGLVAWGLTMRLLLAEAPAERTLLPVRLCASYWHFLLAVWLVLFGLLFASNENLEIILSICGLR